MTLDAKSLAPSSAPPPYYPPRKGCGSGCLWGCLALIVLVSLPVILAGGFGAWFWTDGYKREPAFRLVAEFVKHDGLAQQVLGPDLVVTGVDSNTFSWMPGLSRHDYSVTLQGSKGEGHLTVTSHADGGGNKLDSAILTGPDGRRYDLLAHRALFDGKPDTSI
jgi:hypothetical protein